MTWTRFSARTVRYDPLAGVFQPPGEATIRRVLETVDAAALDAAVGSWLTARLAAAGRKRRRRSRRGAVGSCLSPRLSASGRKQSRVPRWRRALAVAGKAVRAPRHASADGQAAH